MAPYSGWKRTAVYLTCLVTTLTIFLVVMLFVSLFALDKDDRSKTDGDYSVDVTYTGWRIWDSNDTDALGQSILWEANCDATARANLWIHLAINIISTGVLASSNFFMQSLVAPTRKQVDAAHRSGHYLEIGVQSLKNFRFLGWRKVLFWIFFSFSSVPLHLFFNGCVLESKGTNGFTLFLGADSLANGSWQGGLPIESYATDNLGWILNRFRNGHSYGSMEEMKGINESIYSNGSGTSWQRITFDECMDRYNDPEKPLTHWRHLIMVMHNFEDGWENRTNGWKISEVFKDTTGIKNMTNTNTANPLWAVDFYVRTGNPQVDFNGGITTTNWHISPGARLARSTRKPSLWVMKDTVNHLDTNTGLLVMDPEFITPEYRVMKVDYCWSEEYEARCRLSIANILLLIVCIMCALKCVLCFSVLRLRVWGDDNPLMTPGDAIASFISRPDKETKDMCTLSLHDLRRSPFSKLLRSRDTIQGGHWLQGPRQWHTSSSSKFGKAVPRSIWVLSSLLIGSSLTVMGTMLGIALSHQSLTDARFGHSPVNMQINNRHFDSLRLLPLAMIANLPQLILSICYLAYNGLFTRMLAEFEWAKYSVDFRVLRVTDPKGSQNSTYRLQLPYRFSIPLIVISTALHWLYSNCIYVSNYESFSPRLPYEPSISVGLQFSSKAILVAFILSLCVATLPLLLANVRLPGIMVISGGNSAVISAACHYPSQKLESLSRTTSRTTPRDTEYDSMSARLIEDEEAEVLQEVARQKLKWGRISMGKSDDSQVGHLSFGTEDQEVDTPVDGEHYSGF